MSSTLNDLQLPRQRKTFLSANWQDLIILNYAVPDQVLINRLPPNTSLDRYQGQAYVSLVAFDFLNTRVFGCQWPGYTNFAEINLRFYVHQNGVRGVSFIREIVPQRLIAWIARLLYNEPYAAAPVSSTSRRHDQRTVEKSYGLVWQGERHHITVQALDEPIKPPESSAQHFFKEHEWGFGRSRQGKALIYRVEHPIWHTYPVQSLDLSFDFAKVYGADWQFLNERQPNSIAFAVGSEIKVLYREGA